MDKFVDLVELLEILEFVNNEVFKSNCEGKLFCVVSVLLYILDLGVFGRNNYLNILKLMGEKYKKKLWGWIWIEVGV